MDITKLVRDASKIHGALAEIMDNETPQLVCLEQMRIILPARFAERNLASLGADTYIAGMYAMVVGNHYAVMQVNAMTRIEPAETNSIMIDGDEYLEFIFDPGNVVISNLLLAKEDTLTYRIYDEILAKARVPWYIEYLDLAKIFDTAVKHAGARIGMNKELTELLVSLIARDPADRTRYFRQILTDAAKLRSKPYYASLKDNTLMATNTVAKLGGGYFRQGTISALVSPAERVERIEEFLLQ